MGIALSTPCYICGTGMEELRLDGRDMKPKPCSKCEQIIQDTVGGRGDPDEVMTWGELALFIFNEDGVEADGETGEHVGSSVVCGDIGGGRMPFNLSPEIENPRL